VRARASATPPRRRDQPPPLVARAGRLLVAALLLGPAVAMAAAAQAATAPGAALPRWTQLGSPTVGRAPAPPVWDVVALPSDPSLLLAATSTGVLRSTDDGTHWAATGLRGLVWTVAVGPDGHTLFAGTRAHGVWRSTDLGLTWGADNRGLQVRNVRAIAVARDAIVLGTSAGVYVSGTGIGWGQEGLTQVSVSSVAVIADRPLGVLAGADGGALAQGALFRDLSVTTGGGWQDLSQGDPGAVPVWSVGAGPRARGAADPPLFEGNLHGLYRSTDGGATWEQLTLAAGVTWGVTTLAVDPRNPSVLYAGGDNGGSSGGGLQRSTDGGSEWTPLQIGLPAAAGGDVVSLTALATQPLTVLAAVYEPGARIGAVARLLDRTVPAPVALAPAPGGGPVKVVVVTAPPTPVPTRPAPDSHRGSGLPRVPSWAPPMLAAAVLLLFFGIILGVRRRRARLEVEGPP